MSKREIASRIFLTHNGYGVYRVIARDVDKGESLTDLEIEVQNYALGNYLVRALRDFAAKQEKATQNAR